jgi:pimeloyl-ACP methyl ester carboxylesterase
MHRRTLIPAAMAALLLTACTTPRTFVSDRISVETRGGGPDVILIPGLTGDREVWKGVAQTLDDRYRLHLVQVNGFAGVPAGANAEGTVSDPVAEEIARYIREANLQRPAVVGHSMGGTIGMMLAARHADRISRLMVVDMVTFMGDLFGPAGSTPEGLRKIADQSRSNILSSPLDQGFLGQMFSTMTLKPEIGWHSIRTTFDLSKASRPGSAVKRPTSIRSAIGVSVSAPFLSMLRVGRPGAGTSPFRS